MRTKLMTRSAQLRSQLQISTGYLWFLGINRIYRSYWMYQWGNVRSILGQEAAKISFLKTLVIIGQVFYEESVYSNLFRPYEKPCWFYMFQVTFRRWGCKKIHVMTFVLDKCKLIFCFSIVFWLNCSSCAQ